MKFGFDKSDNKYSQDIFCAFGIGLDVNVNDFSIYDHKSIYVNKLKIELYVIGESHIVHIPDLDYKEIVASVSTFDFVMHFPIKQNIEISSAQNFQNIHILFKLSIQDITDKIFHEARTYDLNFKFDMRAVTSIKVLPDLSIMTIHTYPEFGKSVKTVTKLHINSS